MTMNRAEWTPDQPLRADATDSDIAKRHAFFIQTHSSLGIYSTLVAREFADAVKAATISDYKAKEPPSVGINLTLPILTRRLILDVLDAVIALSSNHAAGYPDPMPHKDALEQVITLLAERGHVIGAPILIEPYQSEPEGSK